MEEAIKELRAAKAFWEDGAPAEALRCMLRAEVTLAGLKKVALKEVFDRYIPGGPHRV